MALALVAVLVVLMAGYVRLHLPVQPAGVVACSEPRAREHLDALVGSAEGRARDAAAWDAWERGAPAGCADWGLSRMRADRRGPSVSFFDGRGGEYRLFRGSSGWVEYGWELP